MEKKVRGIILLFIFTFILLSGCKKEEKIESPQEKLIPIDLNIDISCKIFTDIHKNFSKDIRGLEIIAKKKEISSYKLSWNQYKIYWTKSWEDLKEKINSEFSKRELKYEIQELNHFKKLTVSYSYILPTGENINLVFFYF
jgi:hypothetical protein